MANKKDRPTTVDERREANILRNELFGTLAAVSGGKNKGTLVDGDLSSETLADIKALLGGKDIAEIFGFDFQREFTIGTPSNERRFNQDRASHLESFQTNVNELKRLRAEVDALVGSEKSGEGIGGSRATLKRKRDQNIPGKRQTLLSLGGNLPGQQFRAKKNSILTSDPSDGGSTL